MRIRLAFEAPLPAYKCWFEVPEACKTVHDLQKAIRKGFKLDDLCKTTRLDLDGFYLLPTSTIAGSLKDSDLLNVMIKRKSDVLPPKSLPVAGGKKRSRDDAPTERSNAKKQKTSKGSAVPHAQKQKQKQEQKQAKNPDQKKSQGNNSNNNNNNKKNNNQGKNQKTPPTNANQQSRRPNKNQAKKTAEPTLNKNASQPKARATSIASTSSESDSDSDSDLDSDSDNSSSSSSSSDSDTSSSSSSDDEDDPKPTTAPRPPPGKGSKQTKQRNARKRFANAQGQGQGQPKEQPQTEPKAQPPQKDQQSKQLEVQASKPKVVMTTVRLNDGPVRKQLRNAKPNHHNNEQPNGQAKHHEQPPNGKVHQKNNTESQQPSKEVRAKETQVEPTPAAEEDSMPRDYDALPRLEGNLNAGDAIAYKTLEMDASYTPVISDFKEAVVLSFSESDNSAEVQLTPRFRTHVELDGDGLPVLGKFDIYDKDELDRTLSGIVTLDLLSLADCRHIRQ